MVNYLKFSREATREEHADQVQCVEWGQVSRVDVARRVLDIFQVTAWNRDGRGSLPGNLRAGILRREIYVCRGLILKK